MANAPLPRQKRPSPTKIILPARPKTNNPNFRIFKWISIAFQLYFNRISIKITQICHFTRDAEFYFPAPSQNLFIAGFRFAFRAQFRSPAYGGVRTV